MTNLNTISLAVVDDNEPSSVPSGAELSQTGPSMGFVVRR